VLTKSPKRKMNQGKWSNDYIVERIYHMGKKKGKRSFNAGGKRIDRIRTS